MTFFNFIFIKKKIWLHWEDKFRENTKYTKIFEAPESDMCDVKK